MRLRSLLFVPGDRPERMDKALRSGADALILDLEDSVDPSRKAQARSAVTQFLLRTAATLPRFVRINPLSSAFAAADLEAVMAARPDGLVLPKSSGAESVRQLDRRLAAYARTCRRFCRWRRKPRRRCSRWASTVPWPRGWWGWPGAWRICRPPSAPPARASPMRFTPNRIGGCAR
ncbi:MAG TPA: aldolase/citrate lyase family protein [Steroidobacteraceae bacterium]|nr:aldolase/citrate lyase family protein [Steroidobacteraceae bacterium]